MLIIALTRDGRNQTLPRPETTLRAHDLLHAQGRQDRFNELRIWSELKIEREAPVLHTLLSGQIELR